MAGGLCCGFAFAAVLFVGTIASVLAASRRVGSEQASMQDLLREVGLRPVPGSAWFVGVVGGVSLAARANRGLGLGAGGLRGDTRHYSKVDVWLPLPLEPIGGQLSVARGHRQDRSFETQFVAELGATHAAVPVPVREALAAWVHETDDDLTLVDRANQFCPSGPGSLAGDVVLVTGREGPLDAAALRPWLEAVAARAVTLRP